MKTKPPIRPKGTLDALANTLGITKRRVSQLLKAGMPDDPAEAAQWRSERENGDDSAAALRKERILLVRCQREKVEHENRVRSEQTISRAEVAESMTKVYSVVRDRLLRFSNDMPPRLEGLEVAKMAKLIRDEVIVVLTELSSAEAYADPSS